MTIDQNTTPQGEETSADVSITNSDGANDMSAASQNESTENSTESTATGDSTPASEMPLVEGTPDVAEPAQSIEVASEGGAVSESAPEPAASAEAELSINSSPQLEQAMEATAPVEMPEPKWEVANPVSESAPQNEARPAPVRDDMDLFEAEMNRLEGGEESASDYRRLSRGDRLEATVIQVDKDRVFVDLGTKSEGIVPLDELTHENIEHAGDHVKVGDKIQVVVMRPEGTEGNPIVSKKAADFEAAWDRIEQSFREGVMLNATVVDRVKGGLVVDIGVRGFVPATHVGSGKLRNIERYVGQQLQLKIIEIDRDRKKVVLSNREAEERRRAEQRDTIFATVKPGDILDGSVRRLTDYGAFVDLGGVDGLLHISEMSWMRIKDPSEVLHTGQKIKVMVLRIDPDAGKVSLGLRQVLPDPWNLIRENYAINQKITIKISRLVPAGAFVKLPEGAEAFLPLSEMSSRRLRRPEEAIEEGQEVEVQVIDLRPDERRMVLSIRALGGGPADSGGTEFRIPKEGGYDDDEFRRGLGGAGKKGKKKGGGRRGRDDDDFEDVGRRGFASGGATIGERLGMLKGFKVADDDEDEEPETPSEDTTDEE